MNQSIKSFQRTDSLLLILFMLMFLACGRQEKEEEDQFSKHIRTTDARTPEGERSGFKLPPGFKIELFASEPDIGKPMNLSFDAQGRMWVTQSNEYPFPDTTGAEPDRITILEDTDGDGRADKFTEFADSLNIPIGITPVPDGAIAYSIPNVYYLKDNNGDDVVDERKVLLSGFEYKDTHGMVNNFMRGLDGWIHADHGFSNQSLVVGTDNAPPVVMSSGNTFRFRLDGTGVEFTTTGRVNPFGYALDEMGYLYSVDCHSSPIYQLVRGADYPHFGKQPTGIGFGPFMMRHEYGSTALAGLEYYTGNLFPDEFQESFYLGDVVLCRVLRSSMTKKGTTPIPNWETDFVISEDPWFRPVDVKQGPDGAIYIADFYNRIIGHYEVPLDHPGRDRERGRIWRITYEENEDKFKAKDWTEEDLAGLLEGLKESSQTVRMMVADQIVDRYGEEAIDPVKSMINSDDVTDDQVVHGMWVLFRLNALNNSLLESGLSGNERIKVHTLRIMFEMDDLSEEQLTNVRSLLTHESPHIKRAVTMVLAKYPSENQLQSFLDLLEDTPEEDTHLYYSIRQCLRDHLRDDQVMVWVLNNKWSETDSKVLADVSRGVDNQMAASFLLGHLKQYSEPVEVILEYVTHAARYLSLAKVDDLVSVLRSSLDESLDTQYKAFLALQNGINQRGETVKGKGAEWSIELATAFLKDIPDENDWQVLPSGNFYLSNPWTYEVIEANENFKEVNALISGPYRGRGTAISELRSADFPIPDVLKFVLVGQKNPPDGVKEATPPTNKVELFIVGEDQPIRQIEIVNLNHRQEVSWDLKDFAGKQGYLLVTDGSSDWGEFVGIGEFPTKLCRLPEQGLKEQSERQIFAGKIAETYGAKTLEKGVSELFLSERADVKARLQAGSALLNFSSEYLSAFDKVISNPNTPPLLKSGLVLEVADQRTPEAYKIVREAFDSMAFETQKEVVLQMSSDLKGINEVLSAAANVEISPRLLLDPKIAEGLSANMTPGQASRYNELTENLQPFSEEIQTLIDQRIKNFDPDKASVETGAQVFQQNCAICHQIEGQGGNIGPQLKGIGNWGIQALSEKILDPNRNISKAFINYRVELKDGKIRQGLFRRDEGKVRVFADAAGQEFTIPISEIKSQTAVPYTLMPDNFSVVITEENYNHLMKYLLNQK